MAKKSKKSADLAKKIAEDDQAIPSEDIVEDAEILGNDVSESVQAPEDVDAVEQTESSTELESDLVAEEAALAPEEAAIEEPPVEPAQAAASEPARSGGFFPMLLGGLCAGAVGYGIAYFQWGNQDTINTALADQKAEIAELKAQIGELPPPTDIAPLEGQVGEIASSVEGIAATLTDLEGQAVATTDRIVALERRPNADGTLADTALAAFEEEIQGLRDQLQTQESELQSMASDAASQLQATRDEAISIEENAVAIARKATARTVLAQVQSAIDTGAPIGALLSDLGGSLDEPLPEALTAISEGAPTLASLQESFPEQARAALSIARSEGVSGEETTGLGSFLRNQFDVRSVVPKDGATADAILSRVEASVRTGQLNDALAELAGLPEVVRGALTDWTGQAELRAAALDAVASLSDTLNIN